MNKKIKDIYYCEKCFKFFLNGMWLREKLKQKLNIIQGLKNEGRIIEY